MSVSLTWQVTVLCQCLAVGAGVGLLYDLLRQVRLLLPRRWLQEGADLLFWMGACGALFFCAIVLGDGRVRLYIAACLVLGAAGYFRLLSPWVRRGLGKLFRWLGRVMRVVTAPVRWLGRVLAAPLAKIFGRGQKTLKKFFSFSRLWSTIYHPPLRNEREAEERKEAAHVPLQKGWSCDQDPLSGPSGLHDLYPHQRPAENLRRQRRRGDPHPAGQRPDPGQHRPGKRHRKPR